MPSSRTKKGSKKSPKTSRSTSKKGPGSRSPTRSTSKTSRSTSKKGPGSRSPTRSTYKKGPGSSSSRSLPTSQSSRTKGSTFSKNRPRSNSEYISLKSAAIPSPRPPYPSSRSLQPNKDKMMLKSKDFPVLTDKIIIKASQINKNMDFGKFSKNLLLKEAKESGIHLKIGTGPKKPLEEHLEDALKTIDNVPEHLKNVFNKIKEAGELLENKVESVPTSSSSRGGSGSMVLRETSESPRNSRQFGSRSRSRRLSPQRQGSYYSPNNNDLNLSQKFNGFVENRDNQKTLVYIIIFILIYNFIDATTGFMQNFKNQAMTEELAIEGMNRLTDIILNAMTVLQVAVMVGGGVLIINRSGQSTTITHNTQGLASVMHGMTPEIRLGQQPGLTYQQQQQLGYDSNYY